MWILVEGVFGGVSFGSEVYYLWFMLLKFLLRQADSVLVQLSGLDLGIFRFRFNFSRDLVVVKLI